MAWNLCWDFISTEIQIRLPPVTNNIIFISWNFQELQKDFVKSLRHVKMIHHWTFKCSNIFNRIICVCAFYLLNFLNLFTVDWILRTLKKFGNLYILNLIVWRRFYWQVYLLEQIQIIYQVVGVQIKTLRKI